MPSGTTSLPIPSPAITAMLKVSIRSSSSLIRGEKRCDRRKISDGFQLADKLNHLSSFSCRPPSVFRTAPELRCRLVERHWVFGTSFAKRGTAGNGLPILECDFQNRGHSIETRAFSFWVDIEIDLADHRLHVRPLYHCIGKLAEACL